MKALSLARRELRAYFDLPIAYVVLPAFLIMSGGWLFHIHPYFVTDRATLRPFFEFAPFSFTFFMPAISMRLLAEERRSGTLELLLSWPVSEAQIVAGKFLGGLGLLAVALVLTLPFALSVSLLGPLDWGPVVGGYLGLLLLGAAYLSMGLLVSAMVSNQIVAFIAGFALCFAAYILGPALPALSGELAALAEGLSFERRFARIARGLIDLRDLAFFASVTLLCLGLAAEQLAARRWLR